MSTLPQLPGILTVQNKENIKKTITYKQARKQAIITERKINLILVFPETLIARC